MTIADFVEAKHKQIQATTYRKDALAGHPGIGYKHIWKQTLMYQNVYMFLCGEDYQAWYRGEGNYAYRNELLWLNKYDAYLRRRKLRLLIGT